jgi:tryptophan synthase beta chain
VIGREARAQMLEQVGHLPDAVFACVGGGSNAIGIFSGFLDDQSVQLFGAEAAGHGLETDKHAATLEKGSSAVFHGMHSLFLQDQDGQIAEAHSISAGLDYPGVGPEHAHLHDTGRVKYLGVSDDEALHAFEVLSKKEGIIPAFESAHAVALALREVEQFKRGARLLINLSGRGDKDLDSYMKWKEAQA